MGNVSVLRELLAAGAVRLEWRAVPRGALMHWHLLVLAENGRGVSIDTGLTTVHHDRDLTKVQGPAVKAVACILAALGPRVVLPTGRDFDPAWFEQSLRAWPWSEPPVDDDDL